MGVGHTGLVENWLNGAPVETGKTMKRIGGIGKYNVVQQYLM